MREAFRLQQGALVESIRAGRQSASLVFMFKGAKDVPVERLKLEHIQNDVITLCRTIALKL
jgi:hypothetical protein